jgi:membrane associated rhomboid family serine protease
MYVLYFFGFSIIENFKWSIPLNSNIAFLILVFSAIIISSIKSYFKEKNNYNYNAIGASGAVSAVVFANILYEPLTMYSFFFIRKPILPAIVFGILYLVYSGYMSKKKVDNIGHDAHFWGAVYGFIFPVLLNPSLLMRFFNELLAIF